MLMGTPALKRTPVKLALVNWLTYHQTHWPGFQFPGRTIPALAQFK
jgi:hypothetical protein